MSNNKYKSQYRETISKYNGNCSDCGIEVIANITQIIICPRFKNPLCLDCGTKGKGKKWN